MDSKMTYYDFDGSPAYGPDIGHVTVVMPDGSQRHVYEIAKFSDEAYPVTKAEFDAMVAEIKKTS